MAEQHREDTPRASPSPRLQPGTSAPGITTQHHPCQARRQAPTGDNRGEELSGHLAAASPEGLVTHTSHKFSLQDTILGQF